MATMAKRLYVVTEQLEGGAFKNHLVNAVSKSGALSHVVMPKHVVGIATPAEVAKLMGAGVKVEEALTEPNGLDPANVGNSNNPLPLAHNADPANKVKVSK